MYKKGLPSHRGNCGITQSDIFKISVGTSAGSNIVKQVFRKQGGKERPVFDGLIRETEEGKITIRHWKDDNARKIKDALDLMTNRVT